MKKLLLLAAVALAFWPSFPWYLDRVRDGSDEPWGVIALALGIGLLYLKREAIEITHRSLAGASAILLAYAVSYSFIPPLLRAMIALLALAILTRSLRRIPAVWAVLVLSLPLIASLQFYLGYPMRWVASFLAETLLTGLGMEVTRAGTDLWREGRVVGVDPPCSGVEMLWVGLLFVATYAAAMNWRTARTAIALGVGALAMVLGNSVRVVLLYFKESGLLDLPEWTHEGIGLGLFGLLILLLGGKKQSPPLPDKTTGPLSATSSGSCFLLAGLAMLAPVTPWSAATASPEIAEIFPGWPAQWEDRYLEALPLTATEEVFSGKFPGRIGVFTNGPDKIIIRWVTRPTRRLHSSADCLRASGYEIEKERSGSFLALGPDGGVFVVEEKVFNETETWPEISQWFWNATLGKTKGPWWAVTVIRPVGG